MKQKLYSYSRLMMFVLACAALPAQGALRFDGVDDYVTFGVAPGLGATNFTIECWFKRQGAGVPTSTGTGGVNPLPLVTKGRAENELGLTNMNYFLGITTNNVVTADFEDKNSGLNHPITGIAVAGSNVWQHVAVTYRQNGTNGTWITYLNGVADMTNTFSGTNVSVTTPEGNSIQHAALGSALTTAGVAAGFFAGSMEEVRIWNVARSAQQIATNKNLRITSAPGLIGRWPLTETSGTTANDTSGSVINGSLLNGPAWITDSPPLLSVAITSPANNANFTTGANIPITASASTPNGSVTNVAFFAGATKLGDATTGPVYSYTWNSVPNGSYALTAVVSDNLGATSTSAPVNITVSSGAPAGTNLVFNFNNVWRYQQTSNLDGTTWKQPAYNDAAWPSGPGVLALEDCDCLPQPILTPLTLSTNRLAHYFRTHFTFTGDPAQASLLFSNLLDNGGVFYLNGVEIQRVRMPAGTITDSTPASESVGNATSYDTFIVPGSNLVVGDNVLAAEVHQADYTSSDVVFGSSLSVLSGSVAPSGSGGLSFDGADDMVTFGVAPGLGATNFTIECWFKQQGEGKRANTGTSGIFAVPLVTKGMAENEAGATNMNYFFGIGTNNSGQAVLAADFEDFNNGLNHPVRGNALVTTGVWQHGAVTYNVASSNWVLYLNGVPDATATISGVTNILMLFPRYDSIQHAALGSSLHTGGTTNADSGFFAGTMDEVRIWNYARSDGQILTNYNRQITNDSGLIARWSLDDATGTAATNSISGGVNGTLVNGPVWAAGYPFPVPVNNPPGVPVVNSPANGATGVSTSPTLNVTVSDPETNDLTVTFYGRVAGAATAPDFTLVALPDTQYYVSSLNGGLPAMFTSQTDWIVTNRSARNIQYVAQLGDCVEHGDNGGNNVEWLNATNALYRIENPLTTLLPEGVPYGVAVGNHDQSPIATATGTTTFYNQYFGTPHFQAYNYYGDHYGTNNDNHYDLFSAGGMDFIAVYFEYDSTMTTNSPVLAWANSVLQTNQNRRAIVVSHWIINAGFDATFGAQGQAIYDGLKGNTNLFLMLCGHVSPPEGQRTDTFNGHIIWSVLSDYQGRTGGGDGWLRLYEFSPANNVIHVKTYSPWLNQSETDSDSQFDIPYDMAPANPFTAIATNIGVASGTMSSAIWVGLLNNTAYDWYVTVSDGVNTTTGPVMTFTTATNGLNTPPTISSITGQTISEDASTGPISFIVGDAETAAGNLTLGKVSSNPTLVPSNNIVFGGSGANRTVTVTPAANQNGAATITVSVSDGQYSVSTNFVVTVNAVNDAPTISSISNQTINVNGTTGPLSFTVGDVETAAGSLTLGKASSNPTLAPTNNIVFGGANSNRTVTVTPAAGQSGSATITVSVSDGQLNASNSFVLTVSAQPAGPRSFTNTAAITIPDSGAATPYPSVINVSNMVGTISNLTVTLRDLSHAFTRDIDVLLVGPTGTNLLVMSDAGSGAANNVTLTFSAGAAAVLPQTALVTGTYRPTNYVDASTGGDNFPGPAPAAPYGSALSAFNGQGPNGTWSLYVFDDGPGDVGSIAAGWSLTITTVTVVTNAPPVADNQSLTNAENAQSAITLTGSDPEGNAITFALGTLPTHGLLSNFNAANGTMTYTPAHGYTGVDSLTFTVSDASTSSPPATFTITVLPLTDVDADNMPDAWESAYGVSNPNVDADGDGMLNWQEYEANTNPTNASSVLRITSTTRLANGNVVLVWKSVGGTRYRVGYCNAGTGGGINASFTNIVRPISAEMDAAPLGTDSTQSFTDDFTLTGGAPPNRARYYRVEVVH